MCCLFVDHGGVEYNLVHLFLEDENAIVGAWDSACHLGAIGALLESGLL